MSDKNAPVQRFTIGYVTASVWRNGNEGGEFYNVTVERTYRDRDNKLANSKSLGHGDLLNAIKVLERAERWVASQA